MPFQGVTALSIGLGWFVVVMLIFNLLTRVEKKYLPKDQDEH